METHNKCCCHNYNGHFSSVIKCICDSKIQNHPHCDNKNRWNKNKQVGLNSNTTIEKKKKCCS